MRIVNSRLDRMNLKTIIPGEGIIKKLDKLPSDNLNRKLKRKINEEKLELYKLVFYKSIKADRRNYPIYLKILNIEKDLKSLDMKEIVFKGLNFQ